MTTEVSLLAAFVAGVLSISSPCVLPLVPLVPLYLTHLAGVSADDAGGPRRSRVPANAIAYVLGCSLVFVALGVALGSAGGLVETATFVAGYRFWLVRLGGARLVLLGLHQIRPIRSPFLMRERRFGTGAPPAGRVTSSFVVGMW